MAEPQNPIPQVEDKRSKIAGLLPKNAQTRVLAGVAILMILVMMFSGRKGVPTKAPPAPVHAPTAMDPNAARIQEYRARIEQEARELDTEEAQLAQTKQAFGLRPANSAAPRAAAPESAVGAAPEKNWIAQDREKRDYQGLYASNIALSYRPASAPPVMANGSEKTSSPMPASAAPPPADGTAESASTKRYRLFEGTIIETVLTNRLDSSFSGPVNCMVTTDVYAPDHQTLLIPQGTRVLGEVRKLEAFGEQRLAVSFHRMLLPDGTSINLDQFKGLDQVGQTGLRDQVNHHYLQVFGVSLAIGAIAGLSQATTRYSVDESAAEAYQQGVANSMSQSSLHILDRYLNVLPTFTIREGHRIKIYLSQDLLVPAYREQQASNE